MLESSETNNAIITTLQNVRSHPNADRLKLATVLGTQVVVGLEAKDDDVVIYFDSNLCLSHEYLYHNNLYSNKEMNADNKVKGYFGKNGRVRAQRFRGEVSNGYVAEIKSLDFVLINTEFVDGLDEGDEFTSICGIEICGKYIVPVKGSSGRGGNKKVRVPISDMFWKHWDTKQLMRESHRIPPGTIFIEEKIHGTSGRTGKVLCKVNHPWWKFWEPGYFKAGFRTGSFEEWKIVSGTRRVDATDSHLSEIRKRIERQVALHLHKGEQIYYEIYGFDQFGGAIQTGYPYGCVYYPPKAWDDPNTPLPYKVMLYRVTITTPDGFCFDLDREQVYKRAEELGLEKPVVLSQIAIGYEPVSFHSVLDDITNLAKGKSMFDASTLREGIVVWFKDKEGKWACLKHKSEEFLIAESKNKDKEIGDVEDLL